VNDAFLETMVAKMSAQICQEIDNSIINDILKLADESPVDPLKPFKKTTLNTSLDVVLSELIIARPESAIIVPDNLDELLVVPNAISWIMKQHDKLASKIKYSRKLAA
jgi:hypothetical protein